MGENTVEQRRDFYYRIVVTSVEICFRYAAIQNAKGR